jgi:hypothetical protein
VTQLALTVSTTTAARGSEQRDPLIAALARYVDALHRRYPEGPSELRSEGLDARAKVSRMVRIRKDPAA